MKPALLLALLLAGCAGGVECGPGAARALRAELLFGVGRKGAADIQASEWARFLADTVTPRFPEGLTVLDGTGQWRSTTTRQVVSENSRIVLIAAPDTAETARKLREIAEAYDRRFAQEAVGLITERACIAFIGPQGA